MTEHPSTELLSRYLAGRTSADESQLVEQHIAQCEECTSQLDKISSQGDAFEAKLVASAQSSKPEILRSSDITAGTAVGSYILRELLGQGGMGQVWQAEQTEPIKRTVAIKLVKSDLAGRQVLARFEAERQALTMMDHPNIARILDAGAMPDGKPYFVMELVRGIPINRYCDEARLNTEERLALFIPVCQAIQHAHQKGIIHRDLKPSNILITQYDGKPVPKVIDFGVAKAVHQPLTDQTMQTELGSLIGTLEYMSPEQADLNNLDIDTRADIYSLGVILYELLAGSPPFTSKQLRAAAFTEMLRLIREIDPPKPSTKLSKSEALPSIASNRKLEPRRLQSQVSGDLDWIVMKALEKDRNQRYETANGFAADVLRYLSGEPVAAHPPNTAYRLNKFIRRNRVQVFAGTAVFLALIAGVVGTSWQAIRAERAREDEAQQRLRAEQNEREAKVERGKAVAAAEAERKSKEEAIKNLAFAKKGNEILGSVFTGLNPKANYATVGDLSQALKDNLKKAVKELEGSAIGDPLSVAVMQCTLGSSLLGLGEGAQAITLFERARATFESKLGADHLETLKTMNNLAASFMAAKKLEPALPLLEETLRLQKTKLGADHLETLTTMSNLAEGYRLAGKFDLALPLFVESIKLRKAKLGDESFQTLISMDNLSQLYRATGKLRLAISLSEEILKIRKTKLGTDHPDTLHSINNLATCYWQARQLAKSVPLFEELLAKQVTKLGRLHPETQNTVANLGVNYSDVGRFKEALPLLEEAYANSKRHAWLRWVAIELVDTYAKTDKPTEVIALTRELLPEIRQSVPKESSQLASKLAYVGSSLLRVKAFAQAEPLLRESVAILETKEPDAWTTFCIKSMLGGALLGQKKYADAESLLLKGYEGMKTREKSITPQAVANLPKALDRLIELYTATNKPDEVKRWQAERAKYPNLKSTVQAK